MTSSCGDDVGVVLLACSDDICFLERSVPQLLKFARVVSIAFGTRRWCGAEEDMKAIDDFSRRFRSGTVRIVTYDPLGDDAKRWSLQRGMTKPDMMPESVGRYVAYRSISFSECGYVLFLDADEIVDGDAFRGWLATGTYRRYSAVKFANYWFWRAPTIRARDYWEDSVVMLDRNLIDPSYRYLFDDMARTGYYDRAPGDRKTRRVTGLDGLPMISHYSWCRTQRGMLNKVRSWGHRKDFSDLEAKVREEFSRDFDGTDFLERGLRYDVLERDPYDILLV